MFLDQNPERLLQTEQLIFIQAVSLDEHQCVQLPYINISHQQFKLIQKFDSLFLSDTSLSIIKFFYKAKKSMKKQVMALKAASKNFEVTHKTFLYEILKWGENSDLTATIRVITGKLGSLSHLVEKELSDGYKTWYI